MRKFTTSVLFAFAILPAFGQTFPVRKHLTPNPFHTPELTEVNAPSVRNISPSTAFLLLDMKTLNNNSTESGMTEAELIKKYSLIKKEGVLYANSFILVNNEADLGDLKKEGILLDLHKGNFITALIPVNKIATVSEISGVKYIQIGEKAHLTLDAARAATNVNQVHAGTSLPQAYFGDGVVVGIIGVGLDYTHPNFYDSTGTNGYRIKRVWEQNATSGTPPAGFNYGRELATQSTILAAETDNPNESHGTHVTGIAAGAGGGASTTYEGVAPKSDIVFVATTMTNSGIADGISYIQDYAASVGKPCVINMSLGGTLGAHDGMEPFNVACDSFFTGKGRILVGSAGNSGDDSLYLQKNFTSSDTELYTFVAFPYSTNGTNGSTKIDVWGDSGDNFYVGAYIYNTNTNQFEDATPYLYNGAFTGSYSDTLQDDDFFLPDNCYINIATGISPNNNKPEVMLAIDNTAQDDNYRYIMLEIRSSGAHVQMWGSGQDNFNNMAFRDNNYIPPVMSGNTNSTISDLVCGHKFISVGAYTSKNSWTAFNQNSETAPFYTALGAIAPFSSKGPTSDGRTKPDITAPGNVIVSSVNSFNTTYNSSNTDVVYGVTNGTKDWWFASMQGTSMAAPMVSGIIALWLEMYPELTPQQAKDIMRNYAITDSHTGIIPIGGSNLWGWGKINAWLDIPNLIPPQPTINPNSANLCSNSSVTLSAPSGFSSYLWNTGATTQTITVNTGGQYKVKVTNSSGIHSIWSSDATVTVVLAPAIPTITRNGDILTSSATNGNQWYRNNNLIAGATAQNYTISQSGNYKVIVTNSHGCSSESATLNATPTGIENVVDNDGITIFPNPAKKNLNISFSYPFSKLAYTIYDNTGKSIKAGTFTNNSKGDVKIISLGDLANGIYSIRISGKSFNYITKFTVIK